MGSECSYSYMSSSIFFIIYCILYKISSTIFRVETKILAHHSTSTIIFYLIIILYIISFLNAN